MITKAKVDIEKCIGCGTCPMVCPSVFELGDDFKAFVKEGSDVNLPAVKEAEEVCPVAAIIVKEE